MTDNDELRPLHPHTRAIRSGRGHNDTALAPVLWASSTFVAGGVEEAHSFATDITAPKFYGRHSNPTVADFQDAIASLEGAEAARAFASGMGAVSAAILGLCSSGDHIVTQHQLYSHTRLLFQAVCPRFGIDVTFVDGTEPGAFANAIIPGKTTLVFAESPANPKLSIIDVEALGALKGPMTVVDSTFAT
ncbi:MAG: PLP-dependent transferase, partial [Actinomycetia bacterium]|nr:PLP-dependent transferase [Actinomycetes bacterium]